MYLHTALLLLLAVTAGQAAPHHAEKSNGEHFETEVHYHQQQHAGETGYNLRFNLNKILIAVLPFEEAVASLGGGSHDDFDLSILSFEDLKPPPQDPDIEEEEEEEKPKPIEATKPEEGAEATTEAGKPEDAASTTATVSSTEPAAVNKRLQKTSGLVRRPLRSGCTREDAIAGKCTVIRRPNQGSLARLLIPFLQRLRQD